jgi:hypothetical protein
VARITYAIQKANISMNYNPARWLLRRRSALLALTIILILVGCTGPLDPSPLTLERDPLAVPAPQPYVALDLDRRNLLPNGDLERGAGSAPDGWQPATIDGSTAAWTDKATHSGTHALLLANSFNGESTARARWAQAEPTAVQTATIYLLRVWVRTEGVTAGTVWVRANYANAAGDLVDKETRQVGPLPEWTEVRMLLAPPSYGAASPRTAASLKVSLELDNSGGSAWFDDLALVALTPQEATLARPVGHFEPPPIVAGTPPKLDPSAFYRVQQVDGVWWLVAPDGQAFWRTGVNDIDIDASENPCHYQWAIATYGSADAYRKQARVAAAQLGFSGDVGSPVQARMKWLNFSDNARVTPARLGLQGPDGQPYEGDAGELFGDPFNPEWRANVEAYLDKTISHSDVSDPQLAGYFTDNELRFDRIYDYIWSPAASTEFVTNFLPSRYKDIAALNAAWSSRYHTYQYGDFAEMKGDDKPVIRALDDPVAADLHAFARRVVQEYIQFTTQAIRQRDPNHLVVSNRFAAASMPDAASADLGELLDLFKAYDIIAVNLSPHRTGSGDHYLQPNLAVLRDLFYAKTGRPVMITEFSVGALDSGINPVLRWRTRTLATQAERGAFYRNAVAVLANLPFTIGASWYKWDNSYYRANGKEHACPSAFDDSDAPDWDARNSGIVDDHDRPYPALRDAIRTTNDQVRQIERSAGFDLNAIAWDTAAFSAPAMPSELSAARQSASVTLRWQPNRETDLAGYVVYRDDQPLAITFRATWTDPDGSAAHSYRVAAYDANSNTSDWSAAVQP